MAVREEVNWEYYPLRTIRWPSYMYYWIAYPPIYGLLDPPQLVTSHNLAIGAEALDDCVIPNKEEERSLGMGLLDWHPRVHLSWRI